MSELAIFIVGSIIFAITVYGSVMGGGIALGRLADHEAEPVDSHDTADTAPGRTADPKGPDSA
ncbi:hypothetical protein [Rhabdothermincola salaria]|uniref:hypothetical protein n=1 Tax=Rhabdothermincola salaria TaxID=2903142 RepID=UPI001E508D2A|nr:hypothetical protein [Rhabdothermincola salaria]MCD9623659.1 hypothetical protein [Rhabdothermincola salaria]